MREPELTDNDINQLLEFLNTLDYDTLRFVEQLAEAHPVALLQARDDILNLLKNKIARHNQTLGELSEPRATPQPVNVRSDAPGSTLTVGALLLPDLHLRYRAAAWRRPS